ncbi:unnamed protein product, partial [Mycena citricolor]
WRSLDISQPIMETSTYFQTLPLRIPPARYKQVLSNLIERAPVFHYEVTECCVSRRYRTSVTCLLSTTHWRGISVRLASKQQLGILKFCSLRPGISWLFFNSASLSCWSPGIEGLRDVWVGWCSTKNDEGWWRWRRSLQENELIVRIGVSHQGPVDAPRFSAQSRCLRLS